MKWWSHLVREEHMGDPTTRTDADLIAAAATHPRAFGELYDRHAAGLYRWARRAGLTESDALDLVSELFARAWVSRRRFRDPGDGSAGPWLFGIARNLVASHRRSGRIEENARRRLRLRDAAETDASEAVHERVDATASRPALERALDGLPDTQRDAVRMRVVDGLDYPEIAMQLSCSETTARQWVSRGLRVLRTRMEVPR
jgi:RNA polymerase sigma factor (sigma-70 family)